MTFALSFVSDGDGTVAPSGTEVGLVFEPGGVVDLYTADDQTASARIGSYAYDGKTLSLKFTDDDFHPQGTAALDLTQSKVTLPFGLISTTANSSTWSENKGNTLHNLFVVGQTGFLAAGLPPDQAADRAVAYGSALLSKSDNPTFDPNLVSIEKLSANRIYLCFTSGCITINLFDRVVDQGPPTIELIESPIIGSAFADTLNEVTIPSPGVPAPNPPTNFDPLEKWALVVVPFKSSRERTYNTNVKVPPGAPAPKQTVTLVSWDEALRQLSSTPYTPQGYGYQDVEDFLNNNGYAVKELADLDATTVNIIQAILAHPHAPGIMLFESHSSDDGGLFTADTSQASFHPFDELNDESAFLTAFNNFLAHLPAEYMADLTAKDAKGQYVMFDNRFGYDGPQGLGIWGLMIRPAFWTWLRGKGVDFSRSLVFIGGCDTDKSSTLQQAIGARAHFAFSADVNAISAEIFYMMAHNLVRHTHSAEEAYYNVLRVLRTKQWIYDEDRYLDSFRNLPCKPKVPSAGEAKLPDSCTIGTREAIAQNFHGYAGDSSTTTVTPFNLLQGGWLTDPKPGNIWWLLFKARWFTQSGPVKSLTDCWSAWWGPPNMTTGGVGDTCGQEAPGEVPSEDEVGYATYLFQGAAALPTSLIKMARWTWNDGAQ
jgi:hypothetical protein